MSDKNSIEAKLQEPFEPNDIKWRVQQSGVSGGRVWMIVLPYITGRAIQKRLDDVFGVFGWEVDQKETMAGDGFICTVSVLNEGRWIKKQDVAPKTGIEPLKGGASGALKRAGALLGIGRYLYQLESGFAHIHPCNNAREAIHNFARVKDKHNGGTEHPVDWQPPALPDWALPGLDHSQFSQAIHDAKDEMAISKAYNDAYAWADTFSRSDIIELFKQDKKDALAKLDKEAQEKVAARLKEVSTWLDGAIKNLNVMPDEGTVGKVGSTYAVELDGKCQGQYFDKKPLVDKLKQAVSDRINAIKEGN